MLSVKQGDIKYHFLRLCYESNWDWTQVSRVIGEHSNHHAMLGTNNNNPWKIIITANDYS